MPGSCQWKNIRSFEIIVLMVCNGSAAGALHRASVCCIHRSP
ncbi:hypothetical protein KPSA1_03193 [Pseudomonas syringae pv. actinidiae]|uniref:Uncharacterized protein n=1 Tax=Pseudomonas syringae pv. actinidiae TaxID=103796 RepID=A0A2V0QME1_PSESF|nr:hypothetical protein KPSA1_03193 [Pseudomonas syringae pv. actinidiae]